MRLCRAIDPPVGCLCCCCFLSSCFVSSSCCCCCILYFCVRVFLIGFFIGSFSPDCSIFSRGSLSLLLSLLARFCRVLCGFRSQDVSVFSVFCFDIFSNFIILSVFMIYEILIGLLFFCDRGERTFYVRSQTNCD